MTNAQEKALARLKRLAEECIYDKEKYEFKRWEVEECGNAIAVVSETGMKNDEGTLAAVFCRDYAFIFIGKRGGAWYYNKRGTKKRFGWYSILQAVCDHR